MRIVFSPDGDYAMTITSYKHAEIVYYKPGGAESEFEPAIGFTNAMPEGLQRLFLELDDSNLDADEIAKGLDARAIGFFMIIKTKSGWHAITREEGTGGKTAALAAMLTEWGLCDEGYARLTEVRAKSKLPFTQILRVWGKHKEPDIVVKRWTPPITPWERTVMELYARHARFEVSATRLAHNCPSFVPAITKEQIESGREAHAATQEWLRGIGAAIEVPLELQLGSVTLRGQADAVLDDGREALVIEYKSTEQAAKDPAAKQQAAIYAAMYAAVHGVPAAPALLTGNRIVWSDGHIAPSEARWKLARRLGRAWAARNARCDRCALKWCRWRKG
ncbi:MAG: PD-(D/E)XK nuclease family protein [Thermofilaceae archaeon]